MTAGSPNRRTLGGRGFALLVAAVVFECATILGSQGGVPHQPARPTSARHPSLAAQEQFDQARRLLTQGELERALEAVRDGLNLAPRSVEGYNLLGIVLTQRQDYTESVSAFQQALKLNPRSTETHNNLGNCYVSQKKPDLAEREFRTTLRLDPKNRDANYNLGVLILARGEPKQAIPLFLGVEPPDPSTQFQLAQAYLRAGETARGLKLAESLSARARDDVRLHFSLGVLLASEKLYAQAIRELELADSLKPGTFEILQNLGQASLRNRDYSKAQAALERALEANPESAEALLLLAQVFTDQGKHLQAMELLTRARKLSPRNTDVIFLLSRLSMMQSYYEDAIQLLEEGVKIAPDRPNLHAALGESYFAAGKVDTAIQEFKTLIRLDHSSRSFAFMGLCYRHLGRFEEAKKYFNDGLKLNPQDATCLLNLGRIENNQGNLAAAEKLLARALRADPDNEDALYELASVRMTEKRYEEAVTLLRRSAKASKQQAQVYYKLAAAERALHRPEAAERDLKVFETLSKDPSSGPYPLQHLFEHLDQRAQLSGQEKVQLDVQDLERQARLHPTQPRTLYLLAETYLKLGRADDARKTIGQLDSVSGGDFRTSLGVGVLLARYRLLPEAIAHFQAAVAVDPSSDDAKYNLSNAYFQARDYEKALKELEGVSPQARKDDAYLALRGDIQARLGQLPDAARSFEEASRISPDNDQHYLSLALTQLRAGDQAGAEKTIRKGLARIPNSGKLFWGLGIVSVLQGRNGQAEENLRKALDLMPGEQSGYSALGIYYYETRQFSKASEVLDRYTRLFPRGRLSVTRIQQALAAASLSNNSPGEPADISPEARQQFLQAALALADQSP